MAHKNAFYAQSGGVTAVINATASGLLKAARKHNINVYAGKNGILGALNEELIDTAQFSDAEVDALKHTPGGVFGSCRYKLKDINKDETEYRRLIEVFKAHNIGTFFYNGGGDSQDTALKVSQIGAKMGYPLNCIGIPKTVDNDLSHTDTCPGFGSVAKYVAVSIREAALDVAAMAKTSTKVFIMEVMGRHAGWIAAASGVASENDSQAPHIILLPEIPFEQDKFLATVKATVDQHDYCVICVSEGTRTADGKFLAEANTHDAFGHVQLGGVAPTLAEIVKQNLGLKYHWAVADYLQRSARHIASQTDVDQAYALGEAAVAAALANKNSIMMTIERTNNAPYQWAIGEVPLADVANFERKMPRDFISPDGFHITQKCKDYILPLIQGEAYPPYKNGLPNYAQLTTQLLPKKTQQPTPNAKPTVAESNVISPETNQD